jgi:rod shape-determining protein MreC
MRTKKGYIFLVFILLAIIILHYAGWLNWLESGVRSLLIPVSKKGNEMRVGLENAVNGSSTPYECSAQLQKTAVDKAKMTLLAEENNELRKQLNFLHRTNYSMVAATVVGRNTDSIEKMVVIDAGEAAGIRIGQPAIVGDGILIGKVAKVEKDIAIVRLLYDNQSKIAATILNKAGSLGVVEGGYGLSVRMNFIPRDEVILVGDQIVTSGLEEGVPRGLLIGEVAVAENEAYQPFQQAVLTTAADLSKITNVSIVISAASK